MSFRVVSSTGWFCVGNSIIESYSSLVSSRDVGVSSSVIWGEWSSCNFGLDLAGLGVTEDELDLFPGTVECNGGFGDVRGGGVPWLRRAVRRSV